MSRCIFQRRNQNKVSLLFLTSLEIERKQRAKNTAPWVVGEAYKFLKKKFPFSHTPLGFSFSEG